MATVPSLSEKDPRAILQAIGDLFRGRSLAIGQFTCTLSAATTAVTDANVGTDSKITLTARHANAAAEVGNGTIYVSSIGRGTFTVTHANSATANRTFDYQVQG